MSIAGGVVSSLDSNAAERAVRSIKQRGILIIRCVPHYNHRTSFDQRATAFDSSQQNHRSARNVSRAWKLVCDRHVLADLSPGSADCPAGFIGYVQTPVKTVTSRTDIEIDGEGEGVCASRRIWNRDRERPAARKVVTRKSSRLDDKQHQDYGKSARDERAKFSGSRDQFVPPPATRLPINANVHVS